MKNNGHTRSFFGRHAFFWGKHLWGTTHPPNPTSSAPTRQTRVPICSFLNSASICIIIKTWNWSVAELWGKNWDTDAHALHDSPGNYNWLAQTHIASISSGFYRLSHAGTILKVWGVLLLHWLDSPRGLHPSACSSSFWTCPQTPPFTQSAQKGWQSTGLELRILMVPYRLGFSPQPQKNILVTHSRINPAPWKYLIYTNPAQGILPDRLQIR